jgi:hypothetical protein
MNDDQEKKRPDEEAGLEREIRQGRKFTPQEAMARMAGPGSMKGASPVSPVEQAEIEIGTWLRSHLTDPAGALQLLVHRQLKGSGLLLDEVDRPLVALARFCQQVLASDYLLNELVREVDAEWGRTMGERPYFDRKGSSPHPDDPYTLASVRAALNDVVRQLGDPQAS